MKDALKKAVSKSLGLDLYHAPTYKINAVDMAMFAYFADKYNQIRDKEGDIVECGVGRGKTLLYLSCLATQEDKEGAIKNRTLYGFDSFEGFPDPSEFDTGDRNPKKGEWSGTSKEWVYNLLKNGYTSKERLENRTKLVKGFFEDTVKTYPGEKIAFLHLDVDLYDSYKVCLEALFPKVVEGGVVLFDEYKEDRWPGATKAIDEYFASTPYKVQQDPIMKKYFLLKKHG